MDKDLYDAIVGYNNQSSNQIPGDVYWFHGQTNDDESLSLWTHDGKNWKKTDQPSSESEQPELPFFIRGKHCDTQLQRHIRGVTKSKDDFRVTLFTENRDENSKHSFFMMPVLPNEGDTLEARFDQLSHLLKFCCLLLNRPVRIGLLTGVRTEWQGRSRLIDSVNFSAKVFRENLNKTQEQFEFLSDENDNIEIEQVLSEADILVAHDGIAGNQYSRLLHYATDKYTLDGIPWFVPKYGLVPRGEGAFIKDYENRSIPSPLPYQLRNIQHWITLDRGLKSQSDAEEK